ncbi:MAG: transcriptional regulator [Candidatus Methanoperedens sp.]|nr:transcriptional regulator [Candidatus Methanoperedens sp.]
MVLLVGGGIIKRIRRTKMELMIEILRACCNGGVNKTKISYSSNLNSKITNEYLKFLIEKEYIINGNDKYQISKNGLEFLNKIINIQTLLKKQ